MSPDFYYPMTMYIVPTERQTTAVTETMPEATHR